MNKAEILKDGPEKRPDPIGTRPAAKESPWVSVFAASVFAGSAVLAFSAALGLLLFRLAIAVVAALLAALLTRRLVALPLAGDVARLRGAALLVLALVQILLLLTLILPDLTSVGIALLAVDLLILLRLPAILPGAALLLMTIVLFICHGNSP